MSAGMRDFALEVHFSKWEFNARYNLAGSEDRKAFSGLSLGYTETFGAPALRDAIADTYDSITATQILCLAGAGEGIYVAMQVLLEPRDHAIVITPNYQSAETVPLSICDVSGVPLDPARAWALDVDRVRDALRPNTKLISINFPNNPTGVIPPRGTIDELIALCRDCGIWLFSDEVYRLIERDPASRVPQIADVYERGLSLNVMSKAYGLPFEYHEPDGGCVCFTRYKGDDGVEDFTERLDGRKVNVIARERGLPQWLIEACGSPS